MISTIEWGHKYYCTNCDGCTNVNVNGVAELILDDTDDGDTCNKDGTSRADG